MLITTVGGSRDLSRSIIFIGVTQSVLATGSLPKQRELPGTTLAEAIAAFSAEINKAVEQVIEEARRPQRKIAMCIVVPGRKNVGKIIT